MAKRSSTVRTYYDARLERYGLLIDEPRPPRGWIRAIRDSLGMSSTELAHRMAVGQATVSGLEQSEVRGTIRLDSLQRAARALDCDVLYYFVPRTTLDDAVRAQARRRAVEQLNRSASAVDAGEPDAVDRDARVDEIAATWVDRRGLWSEVPPPPSRSSPTDS